MGGRGERVLHDLSVSLHLCWSKGLHLSIQRVLSTRLSDAVTTSLFPTHMFARSSRFAEGVWEKGEFQKKAGVRIGEQEAQNLVLQVVLVPVERKDGFS